MVLWGALHSSYLPNHTRLPYNVHLLLHPALFAVGSDMWKSAKALLPCSASLSFCLSEIQPNSSLHLNPSEISEVTAWAKNKNAAGVGPNINRAEAFQWPQLGAGAFSSFLWPPCVQRESGRAQTKPSSLSLIGLTSSAFQNRKLSAAGNSCFFAIISEKQTFLPCTHLVCSRSVFLVLTAAIRMCLSHVLAIDLDF